jgi:hypothetical protein
MIDELIEMSKALMTKFDDASYANVCLDMQCALERMSWEMMRLTTDLRNVSERFGE